MSDDLFDVLPSEYQLQQEQIRRTTLARLGILNATDDQLQILCQYDIAKDNLERVLHANMRDAAVSWPGATLGTSRVVTRLGPIVYQGR
jgi:hypothetical protein